jgi:hypothetical protein
MSRSNIIENLAVLSNGSNGDSVPAPVPAPETSSQLSMDIQYPTSSVALSSNEPNLPFSP